MNAIAHARLGEHSAVELLARSLSPFFQLQAMQCLLSRHPNAPPMFDSPDRTIPALVRVIRLHAAGLPRMTISQLIARGRRAFGNPEMASLIHAHSIDVLGTTPVILAAHDQLVRICETAVPEILAFAKECSLPLEPGLRDRRDRSLSLRLRTLECRSDPHPEWPGPDELHACLLLTDAEDRVSKRMVIHQGRLRAGATWKPDQLVQVFNLSPDYSEPKVITVVLLLGELELSTFANVLEEVYEDLRRELAFLSMEAIGRALPREDAEAAGLLRRGPRNTAAIESLIRAIAGRLVADLIGWLTPMVEDHVFQPLIRTVIFPDAESQFAPSDDGATAHPSVPALEMQVITPCGSKGEYALSFEWALSS